MSKIYAGLSPISGQGIFLSCGNPEMDPYQRLRTLLSEEKGLPHEKSINGRLKRALDTLQSEYQFLPTELYLLHKIVSNSVHVLLGDGTIMDYNEFLDTGKGSYPSHMPIIPDNDDHLRRLSEHMGVAGLYTGYAKLVERIIPKLDK